MLTAICIFGMKSLCHAYDLGGPCITDEVPYDDAARQRAHDLVFAEKKQNWDKVVELKKRYIREMCNNQYRWIDLTKTLLSANRQNEALNVLQEMDRRGLELKPSVYKDWPEVKSFVETDEFKTSPVGMNLEKKKQNIDRQRKSFQEALKALPSTQRPPENFIAKGVCPFECCTYGQWTVKEDANLVEAPGSQRVVGHVKKGDTVKGVTGEVHVKPIPVGVLIDAPYGSFKKGDILFLLSNLGEGAVQAWYKGSLTSAAWESFDDYCFKPDKSCWGEYLVPENERHGSIWWVNIQTQDGKNGWTDQVRYFGNVNACGG